MPKRLQKVEYYGGSDTYWFELPVDDTSLVIKRAKSLLHKLYKPGLSYKKVGIIMLDLCNKGFNQSSLFPLKDETNNEHLIKTIEAINNKMGKRTLFFAAQGTKREWQMRSTNKSPCYTTNWNELLIAS